MFNCEITGRMSKPGEKLNRVVVKTREVKYKHWDREAEEEWFSSGWEIVQEVSATEEGVRLWESWTPEEQQMFVAEYSRR